MRHWKKPNARLIEKKLPKLLSESRAAFLFFRFLATRRRSAISSDIPQLLSYLRNMFKDESVDASDFWKALVDLCEFGFFSLERRDEREKLHWHHWIFPIFNEDGTHLLGIESESIVDLKHDSHMFGRTLKSLDSYKREFSNPDRDRTKLPHIVLDERHLPTIKKADLASYTVEELLAELDRRGLKIQLNATKVR